MPEEAREQPSYVDINHRDSLPVGEGEERVRSITADSRQALQLHERSRNFPAVALHNNLRETVESYGPVVVSHPFPGSDDTALLR